jgi:hypothetical protein
LEFLADATKGTSPLLAELSSVESTDKIESVLRIIS